MTEYLSREDILDIASQYCTDDDGSCSKADVDTREMLDEIEALPAADVQPVKHGKWKHIAGMNSKCSVCSHYFPVTEFDSRPFDINFCPNCGARMDGDTE